MFKIILQVCLPAFCYGLITDLASVLWGNKGTLFSTFTGALLAVPVFGWAYGRTGEGGNGQKRFGAGDGIFCVLTGIAACVLVNTFIMVSPLPRYFAGFSRTADQIYGPPFLFQAAAVGVVLPVAEELVFRGMGFWRIRRVCTFWQAAVLSAAVFGIYHGNMLQGIYGFIMGMVLAWGMERKGTVKAPVLIHMAANLTSVILTAVL